MPHDKLLVLIRQRVVDGSMLRIIKQSLTVGVEYQGPVEPTRIGVPQGSPISPLYGNIYLNLLDQLWHKRVYPEKLGATLHRYADDAVLVCRKNAQQAFLSAFEAIARRMGLIVNREKPRITKLTEGFDFIGFNFVKRPSPNTGKNCNWSNPQSTDRLCLPSLTHSFTLDFPERIVTRRLSRWAVAFTRKSTRPEWIRKKEVPSSPARKIISPVANWRLWHILLTSASSSGERSWSRYKFAIVT